MRLAQRAHRAQLKEAGHLRKGEKAVAVLVNNIIGAGIMPRAASGDEALDRRVDDLR